MPPAGPSLARTRLVLAALVALFVARGLPYRDFVPLWDGRQYADCVTDAARLGVTFARVNCFDHPSAAYLGPLALATSLAPGSFAPMLWCNLLLGAMALLAFHAACRAVLPEGAASEALLATAAFSFHPVLLASAINVNADYGVLVFLLPTLVATLRRRFLLATACGLLLTFSKETGVLYLAALGAAHAGVEISRHRRWRERWHALRPALWFLVAPAALALHYLTKTRTGAGSGLWGNLTWQELALRMVASGNHALTTNYLIGVFVLGFQWLLALGLLAGLVRALRRRRQVLAALATSEAARATAVAAATLAIATYLVLRFPSFLNVRYLLPLVPLMMLAALAGLAATLPRPGRIALWIGVAALLLRSNVATFDPISKALFGTFRFGEAEMLALTSRSHECCGLGRDQLVYNLQFTAFHTLQNAFYADVAADDRTTLSGPPFADWFFFGPLDAATHRRTLRDGPGTVRPRYVDGAALAQVTARPERLYYLLLPNLPLVDPRVIQLYDLRGQRSYAQGEYRLQVLELVRRDQPLAGPGDGAPGPPPAAW